jgi:uncharacterized membrane protein
LHAASAARFVGRLAAGSDVAEHTAALVSTSSIGTSFMPGLLPRGGIDQAVATGIVAATQYGLVVTSQSGYAALARRLVRNDSASAPAGPAKVFAVQAAVGLGVAAVGTVIERALPPDPAEPIRRALVRTLGRRGQRVGLAGVGVAAVAAAEAGLGGGNRAFRVLASGAGLIAGTALAAYEIRRYRAMDEAEESRLARPADPITGQVPGKVRGTGAEGADGADKGEAAEAVDALPPLARSLLIGVAVSAGLQGLAYLEGAFARGVSRGVRRVAPEAGPLAPLIGHGVMLGTTVAAVLAGIEYVERGAETGGAAIDAAYTRPPDFLTVSGGPASVIDWLTLSREGVRFVNMALRPEAIAEVTGAALDQVSAPIRAFAGLASAATVDARVDLVMEDLERLGAFERSVICVASPTGSGYVNYVAIESLEYLTRGDCATVSLQYSLRPSFLSLDRVSMGREQNRALFHALSWRMRSIPEADRPRLVGFGESLGAHTMQDAFLHEGVGGLHRVGMDRALFLGTPAGSKWAKDWRVDPTRTDPGGESVELASHQEWLALDPVERDAHKFVLLSHHEDPIARFEPALAVQQPGWLGPVEHRPPGVSSRASWIPLVSFVLTLIDVKNAMDVVPGIFVAHGHDYRADLARMVAAAYALPVDEAELARIELALRSREAVWAERRLVAEQLQRAKEAVQRQVDGWGLAVPATA